MGRPLYSIVLNSRASSTASSTAASRASSPTVEPAIPVFEKWSPWNAFDPDADAFFESEDAVYEAFLDTPEYLARTNESQPPLLSLVEALAINPNETSSATLQTSVAANDDNVPRADDIAPWVVLPAEERWQGVDISMPFIPPMPMPSMPDHDGESNARPGETRQPRGLPSPDFSENRYTTLYSNYSREDVTPSSYSRSPAASTIPPSHTLLFNDLIYVPGRISGDTLVA